VICKKLISKLNSSGSSIFFAVFILTLATVAIWSYFKLDQQVFSLLCQKPIQWDKIFLVKAFTYLGKTWMLVWLLLIWFLSTGQKRPVLIAFLALIIVSITVIPLKVIVKRPRPHDVIKTHSRSLDRPDLIRSWSFPSGDTATVFAVATVFISFVTWPVACLLLAASTGIGLLRITAMAHYPSDAFAGAAIGLLSGWLAIQIDQRWLPLERPRLNLSRTMATLGIIIIPFSTILFEGIDCLMIFLKIYVPLAICIFLAAKIGKTSG
jgi:undecaprenyl-diphosphatase